MIITQRGLGVIITQRDSFLNLINMVVRLGENFISYIY